MPIVGQGGTVTLTADVRNGSGQPADATSLQLTMRDPAGVTLVGFPVSEPAIVRDSLGHYHYDWTVPALAELGSWVAYWHGYVNAGAVWGQELVEVVEPGSIGFGLLDFLINPDDYNGIRNLLGVTDIDVSDEMIESLPFGPHAEFLVKSAVSDWEDVTPDDPRMTVLRLATTYATAALIAESAAKGGFLGLVRGEGSRSDSAWSGISKTFWEYYARLVEDSELPEDQEGWGMPWMFIASTSRSRRNWPSNEWGSMAPTVDQV